MSEKEKNELALIDILTRLVTIYQSLLDIVKRKQSILAANNIEALKELLKEEESLVLQVESLEKQRLTLREANQWPVTLREWAATLPDDQRKQVGAISRVLAETVSAICIQNNINDEIIQHLSNFARYSLDLIHKVTSGPAYGCGGDVEPPSVHRSIVDRKV